MEIRGDSLGSVFDRWLVFYDQVRRPITHDLIGQLWVGLPDDRILIKKIRRATKDGLLYRLLSEREPDTEDVPMAARVKSMVPR